MAYDLQYAQTMRDAAAANLASAQLLKETQVTGSTGGRRTVYQDIDKLLSTVQYWNNECRRLSRSGPVFFRGVPCG